MTLPILYSFRRCPYAMRARLAIRAAGQSVELREIVLRDKAPEFVAASPKATVPVLVLPDGGIIEESREIMDWALSDATMPMPNTTQIALIERAEGEFKTALDHYKYASRYEGVDARFERDRASAFLYDLNAILAAQPYLAGESQGFTDIAIAPFVRQFAHVDRDWFYAQDWPNLARWLTTFIDSDDFQAIMSKYPKWQDGDPVTLFPEA